MATYAQVLFQTKSMCHDQVKMFLFPTSTLSLDAPQSIQMNDFELLGGSL